MSLSAQVKDSPDNDPDSRVEMDSQAAEVFYNDYIREKKKKKKEKDTTKTTMDKLNKFNHFMERYVVVAPVPFASYTTETSWIIGLSKFNAFTIRNHDTTDTVTQPSQITGLAYYTLKKQWKFAADANLMFAKNKYYLKTSILFQSFPLFFYGIGNNTHIEDQRVLLSNDFQFSTEFMFRVYKKLYIGPKYDFYYYTKVDLDTLYPEDTVSLYHNIGIQSGLGLAASIENRDNRLNAKKGFFLNTYYQIYRKFLGSEYEFDHFLFDFRYYFTVWKKLTIASQVYTEFKFGDVPVQSLPMIGGSERLRGVYEGRYRDHALVEGQVELRFPIFWIFGGVVYAGVGQNMPSYNKLAFNEMHFAAGAGLRLKVDSKHDVNLRFDVSRSSDQTTFFMGFSEAF